MSAWNERPKDITGPDLIAWALAELADAVYNLEAGLSSAGKTFIEGKEVSVFGYAADRIAEAIDNANTNDFYLADKLGNPLERIADSLERSNNQ